MTVEFWLLTKYQLTYFTVIGLLTNGMDWYTEGGWLRMDAIRRPLTMGFYDYLSVVFQYCPLIFTLLRKAATILLLIVFCNSLFYYGYLSCALLKAKFEAKLALARINPRASFDLLRVPVSLLQKDESDEVWYNDKLYDVVERDRINDTLYVFLERDEQEQNVLLRRQKFFQRSFGFISAGGHEVTAAKMALPISDTECIQSNEHGVSRQLCVFKSSSLVNISSISADFSETASPPPKPA